MLRNYIIIALRNLQKQKLFSFINIAGLALGVACCLILALYIHDELQIDRHHREAANLYRVVSSLQRADNGTHRMASCSPPIGPALQDEVPEVVSAARLLSPPGTDFNLIRYEDKMLYESNGYLADSLVFDILQYTFLEGQPANALTQPNTVVITETLAHKLFGDAPALNRIINITQGGPSGDFRISGVVRDETHSHITPNFFVSMSSSGWAEYLRSPGAMDEWAGQNFIPTYVRLQDGHDRQAVEAKMNKVLLKHGSDDLKALGFHKTLSLEPLTDIHLYSDIGRSPRIHYIYIIASIAGFILLLACINFMNLATAKATRRASEIGIRKVMGAFRPVLVGQILGEAMVIVAIAMLISLALVQLVLPGFNYLTGKTMALTQQHAGFLAVSLLLVTVVTGLLAGSYPAFYISAFQPAQVLKGKTGLPGSGWLRKSLVVFQFMIGIVLVCGMLIMGRQLRYMEAQGLGFDATARIVIPLRTASAQQSYPVLRRAISQWSSVKGVSATEYPPGSFVFSDVSLYPQGGNMDNAVVHRNGSIDQGFIEMLDFRLLAGRTFTDNRAQDGERKMLINRTGAQSLGYTPEQAIGAKVFTDWQGQQLDFEIIGVVDDFHQTSLRDKIPPMVFQMGDENLFDYLILHTTSADFATTIASLEKLWNTTVEDTPFEYQFLDENIQKQYAEDRKTAQVITIFTFLAMFISCLGLYGLSAYMAERRYKEIGVRKVMGASVTQIVGMMSGEFIRLVLIAFVLSIPLAWYALQQWLQGFAYHTAVEPLSFVYAGAVALGIALITVAFESWRAATNNPVQSLRNE